ncbi:MAG: NUDIX domain-containing protein [Clostridiales bacterium]|nr:NUDIX domain-containing protein [Clostridiales bacterium]
MKKVYSAGGIVIKEESILMLRKINGDWVLPKGRIEINESESEAAIREVEEETGISAEILSFIGNINYKYRNIWFDDEVIDKYVTWYLMMETKGKLFPLRKEGFVEAKYIPIDRFEDYAKYDDEKKMIREAVKKIS